MLDRVRLQQERQELLNTVVAGMRAQNWELSEIAREDGRLVCAYRGTDGSKCAAGHVMSDELASLWESNDIGCLSVSKVPSALQEEVRYLEPHVDFLHDLQVIHDQPLGSASFRDRRHMRLRMKEYAEQEGLVWPSEEQR